MKKFNVLLAILFLAGASFLTSCSNDDDENLDVTPTISFKGGAGYTSDDANVTVGDSVKVGITATENTNSGEKLNYFEVTSTFNNVEETVDWDAITDDGPIVEYTSTGVEMTAARQLEGGNVIGFITNPTKDDFAGKHGLIRIDAITEGADGSIEISVKVQE